MRLKQFLTEQNYIIDFILSALEDDCMDFIKELKCNFIYRGTKQHVSDIKTVKSRIESGRRPKDTSPDIHNELNYEFKRVFGWNVRDGIFTSFMRSMAMGYGTPYLFFPIGKYKYCYSKKYEDLYNDFIENMDNSSNLYDEAVSSYSQIYSPNGYGNWVTKDGKMFSDVYDIIGEYHLEDYFTNSTSMLRKNQDGDIQNDKITTYFEVSEEMINDAVVDANEYNVDDEFYFQWEPNVDYDSYIDDYISERSAGSVDEAVETYTDKHLLVINNRPNEISFNCKEYYLVNTKYYDEIENYFKGKI